MTALAQVYVEELANGNVPAQGSPEDVAYQEWSKEYERGRITALIVKESCLKVYGNGYYLLGSIR
jgi:hypothetical protein